MNQIEAIRHFNEKYGYPYLLERLKGLKQLLFTQQTALQSSFVKAFQQLCQEVIQKQKTKKKGKIKYINISFLRIGIINRCPSLIMEAYDENWFYDTKRLRVAYDGSWLLEPLWSYHENLEKEMKRYGGTLKSHDVEAILLENSHHFITFLVSLARHSIEKAIETAEFKTMEKEPVYYILAGEYRDASDIIYCNENTLVQPEAKEIDNHFQKAERVFIHEYHRGLNLTHQKFTYGNLSYSSFKGSWLTSSQLIGAILLGTNFKQSRLKDCNLSAAILHDSSFEGAEILDCTFEKTFADVRFAPQFTIPTGCFGVSFKNSQISDTSFTGAILVGAKFSGATLTRVEFENCDLQYCDFSMSRLEEVDFTGAILDHCIFDRSQLDALGLTTDQLEKITLN